MVSVIEVGIVSIHYRESERENQFIFQYIDEI